MQSSQRIPERNGSIESGLFSGRLRPRIAVLLDYMTLMAGAYESEIRDAFDRVASRRGLDLLLVYGQGLDDPLPTASPHPHNAIFELLGMDSVDGIVALASSIGTHCGPVRMREFLGRYGELPLCSLGIELPGIQSVIVDQYAGMFALVEHLVRDHGRQHVAYLGGPPGHPDAEIRFQAYRQVLERYSIEYDGARVKSGQFILTAARSAVACLLDDGVVFDSIVAANDIMAMAAIDVLRERGIRVPQTVGVTGFDDIAMARLGSPPMTTVAQPFAAMAESAIDSLLVQMCGGKSSTTITLPAQFVVRNSCGCTARARREGPISTLFIGDNAREALRNHGATIHAALTRILHASGGEGASDAAQLIDALREDLDGRTDAFLETLEAILERIGVQAERCQAFQRGISYLRERLCPHSSSDLEDLWHDARELVTLYNSRGQVRRRNEVDAAYARMLEFGERLSSALDVDALKVELERSLPVIGVRTAWVSRFPVDAFEFLDPFVALVDGAAPDQLPTRFHARLLFPELEEFTQKPRTWLVFPLVCETQNLGVAVFDYAAGNNGYQMVRDQISTALRTISLHHEVVQKTMLHDRTLQERAATIKRMQSLSILAGGVAHDLNNALGPLVGLPDVMLVELNRLAVSNETTGELRADLEAIRAATIRASHTIKDLLTLSRQGRTAKEAMDLNRTIVDAIGSDVMRAHRETHPAVRIYAEPTTEALVICGSESHVGRAVTNLVRNAVEAIVGAGEVRVATAAVAVEQPRFGYELVEPGQYAVVTVSDSGSGIRQEDLNWIFEPFATKKRVGESSGTGLGLAIVHGVVKEHEGYIDVTSKLGVGTTFTLYFPRKDVVPKAGELRTALSRGHARVLVVDDELLQLRTARRILAHLGYDVDTVSCSTAALERLVETVGRGGTYDLVLIDMMLNEAVDGLQLFHAIRERVPNQRAIIVSGHAPDELAELSLPEGLGWLAKPYSASSLATAVAGALSQEARAPSMRPSFRVGR